MTAAALPAEERARELDAQVRGPLAAVTRTRTAREKLEAKLAASDADRAAAMKAALDAGCTVQDVADAAGVHRSRVWQIVTGKKRRPAAAAQ